MTTNEKIYAADAREIAQSLKLMSMFSMFNGFENSRDIVKIASEMLEKFANKLSTEEDAGDIPL